VYMHTQTLMKTVGVMLSSVSYVVVVVMYVCTA